MKIVPAIIEPAIDTKNLAREIAKAHVALQDCERQLETAEKKTESLRKEQAQRRVEIGRLLIEAKRGIKHGGWSPYLEKLGIESQRASEWMRLAGHVETSKSPTSANDGDLPAPTLADAGIDKRPRKSAPRDEQPDPPEDDDNADAGDAEPSSEFVPVFKRVEKTIVKEAMQMFPKDRQLFAAWLRSVADEIDPTR